MYTHTHTHTHTHLNGVCVAGVVAGARAGAAREVAIRARSALPLEPRGGRERDASDEPLRNSCCWTSLAVVHGALHGARLARSAAGAARAARDKHILARAADAREHHHQARLRPTAGRPLLWGVLCCGDHGHGHAVRDEGGPKWTMLARPELHTSSLMFNVPLADVASNRDHLLVVFRCGVSCCGDCHTDT